MKKTSIACFLLSFSVQFVLAQPTQAEIDKMMKQSQELMKIYGNDTSRNKALKGLEDQQKQVTNAMKNQPANNNNGLSATSSYADPGDYSNVDNWRFPPKNTLLLSALPKKILTKPELLSFLNDSYTQLSKKFPAAIKSSVESIASKYGNNGNKLGDLAVKGWYTDYREEALLLIIKAAIFSPDNGLLLNNCAALLNMSGIEQKAIPILKYVLQSHPASSMLLNNLGQAYAGLGDTDTAMIYLGRCLKIEPENAEANNTAGQIEATKGNIQKAAGYFEQSLKAAYCKPAELKLRKIKKDASIVPLVRPRVKIPEYFNLFKYQVPDQCTSTAQAAVAHAEHQAFREMITIQGQAYGARIAVLGQRLQTNLLGVKSRILQKDEFMAQPYHEFCGIMYRDINKEYLDAIKELSQVTDKKYFAAMTAFEKEYLDKHNILAKEFAQREEQCCGEGKPLSCCPSSEEKCKAFNGLADHYLPQFAAITEDWQRKNLIVYQKYFDELIYWSYLSLHPYGDDVFRLQSLYVYIEHYLVMLGKIANTKIIEPCLYTPTRTSKDSNAIKEMDCPLEIEIPFVVGKFELTCDKFSFSAGEGAVFGYEKSFKTHQSTVSVGIGLKLELEAKAGPVKAGASVGVSETVFITFDGNNKFSDGGLKFDAKASAGVEAGVGDPVKVKTDIGKVETSMGYTMGINSGWNFNLGPFR
jgi:tetratricopeptide (TPR) repeat protein